MMVTDFRGTVDSVTASSDEESSTDYDSSTDDDEIEEEDEETIVYESKPSPTEKKKVLSVPKFTANKPIYTVIFT